MTNPADQIIISSNSGNRMMPGAEEASRGLPRCHDVLLLRVQAALLLALADANGALEVLGAARLRLALARRTLQGRGDASAALLGMLQQQEAQVCGVKHNPLPPSLCALVYSGQ
jgi:hypothetical protein